MHSDLPRDAMEYLHNAEWAVSSNLFKVAQANSVEVWSMQCEIGAYCTTGTQPFPPPATNRKTDCEKKIEQPWDPFTLNNKKYLTEAFSRRARYV